jgi:DNA replication protein DnaC
MERILEEELSMALAEGNTPPDLLERLLTREVQEVLERRVERRIKESKLPDRKLLEEFDFPFQTGVDKTRIMELATLEFVERKQGLVLAGNSGTGKSHIVKALLLIGCKRLYRCRYTTAVGMLNELLAACADDSLEKKLRRYINPEILLIDEVGFDRIEQQDARPASLFLKVIEGRYCRHSTIMTTNIDFKELGDYLGDPVVTTAIVDRMVHHSIIMNIQGPSYRMHESKKLNARPAKTGTKKKKSAR